MFPGPGGDRNQIFEIDKGPRAFGFQRSAFQHKRKVPDYKRETNFYAKRIELIDQEAILKKSSIILPVNLSGTRPSSFSKFP